MNGYDRLLVASMVFAVICYIGVFMYVRYHERVIKERRASSCHERP